jgi:hypothetical protein
VTFVDIYTSRFFLFKLAKESNQNGFSFARTTLIVRQPVSNVFVNDAVPYTSSALDASKQLWSSRLSSSASEYDPFHLDRTSLKLALM